MQNRLAFLPVLCILCWIFVPASALLDTIPGLYIGIYFTSIDSITLWDTSSPPQNNSIGYSFNVTWRNTIPAFIDGYPAVRNFKSGPDNLMSFETNTTSGTQTGIQFNFYPRSNFPGIVYMSFSMVVITENNNDVELLPIQALQLQQQVNFSSSVYIEVNSTKFYFDSMNDPYVNHFIKWIQPASCSGDYYF